MEFTDGSYPGFEAEIFLTSKLFLFLSSVITAENSAPYKVFKVLGIQY
jgi:hypothetical protein